MRLDMLTDDEVITVRFRLATLGGGDYVPVTLQDGSEVAIMPGGIPRRDLEQFSWLLERPDLGTDCGPI